MRVATLQFATTPTCFEDNATAAHELLSQIEPGSLDLLVMPEMALSGYNYTSADHIAPYLEPTNLGPSAQFALGVARTLQCNVVIGYPEICTVSDLDSEAEWAISKGKRYNTVLSVSNHHERLATYRKHHLYYTDQTWASPGPGFASGLSSMRLNDGNDIEVAQGVCMDLNPRDFDRDRWSLYEFASHVVTRPDVGLVVLSNAWNLSAPGTDGFDTESNAAWWNNIKGKPEANRPDTGTIEYWAARLWPLVEDARERAVVICNRCGVESDARYAGSSCVFIVGLGRVQIVGFMGVAQQGVGQFEVDLASLRVGHGNVNVGQSSIDVSSGQEDNEH